jgi:hypothetical protein
MPAIIEPPEPTQAPKPKPGPTPEQIVHESEKLTDFDYQIEASYWREILAGVPAWCMGQLLNEKLTEEGMQFWLERAAEIQDELVTHWPGFDAIRKITGIEKTAGKGGARELYRKFMCEHRLRQPPSCPDYAWTAISRVYADVYCCRVVALGLDGSRVIVDWLAFGPWQRDRRHRNYKPRREWVAEEALRWIPRGPVPYPNKNAGQLLTAPDDWDSEEESPIKWTKEERAAGIHKKIAQSNNFETNAIIPILLANERKEDDENEQRLKEEIKGESKDDEKELFSGC